jgi:hypothetical protein
MAELLNALYRIVERRLGVHPVRPELVDLQQPVQVGYLQTQPFYNYHSILGYRRTYLVSLSSRPESLRLLQKGRESIFTDKSRLV